MDVRTVSPFAAISLRASTESFSSHVIGISLPSINSFSVFSTFVSSSFSGPDDSNGAAPDSGYAVPAPVSPSVPGVLLSSTPAASVPAGRVSVPHPARMTARQNAAAAKSSLYDLFAEFISFLEFRFLALRFCGPAYTSAEERTGELRLFKAVDPASQPVFRLFGGVLFVFCGRG